MQVKRIMRPQLFTEERLHCAGYFSGNKDTVPPQGASLEGGHRTKAKVMNDVGSRCL